jgi:hypothetical protein
MWSGPLGSSLAYLSRLEGKPAVRVVVHVPRFAADEGFIDFDFAQAGRARGGAWICPLSIARS